MSLIDTAQLDAIASRTHSTPHSVLGAHPNQTGGATFRALRPSARSVTVLLPDGNTEQLRRVHPAGIFEGDVKGVSAPLPYRLQVDYDREQSFTIEDPYRFGPTLGELDLHLISEGRHERIYEVLGAHVREHEGVQGTSFVVWAPAARAVSVVGDFNGWDGRLNAMRSLGPAGIWELFLPGVGEGALYKYEILGAHGELLLKADPYAQEAQLPPNTASIVSVRHHEWSNAEYDYISARGQRQPWSSPMSVYEVHLGSWRRDPRDPERVLGYMEVADQLADYAQAMGFTHIELLPVMHHPFSGSWGYQVTGYYAPSPVFGTPDELRGFIEQMHTRGIGVILDWVPAHFPRDDFGLARFDGTALFEHDDPRRGAHPDWGTLVFNFARHEVRNFLIANALFWLREFHADGIRVDAVASMLYLDYSREEGEWIPNEYGGREDLDAVSFLRELNAVIHREEPGVISAAEESTAWPGVSRPTEVGGLGFGFKWNMGWMHDSLRYFELDPIYRRFHHGELTFSLVYAFSENFVLPLSHDEVVHGKGSLYTKMAGDHWQKLANLRTLYAYMWAHPGKNLLFMGQEFAQIGEWSHQRSLDWHLLEESSHAGIQSLIRDLNAVYKDEPALWELDSDPSGFYWLEANDADNNVLAFARTSKRAKRVLACVMNLSPLPREGYRVGLPRAGVWREALNTDSGVYGGVDIGNGGSVDSEPIPWGGQPFSAALTLPPLGVLWLTPDE